ncbi:MAG: hypothetical protein QXY45_00990 [Candidatus Aenigmatarchaeota archaeon]
MKKAQMSLEMIIGLLILLVVAVVVIRIFLKGMSQNPQDQFEQTLKDMNFIGECDRLCNEYKNSGTRAALAKFCYTKMTGNPDLNKNGKIDKLKAKTKLLEICEDSVYCFHMTTCETDAGIIDWSDCRDAVCNEYIEIYTSAGYGDALDRANRKVSSLFSLGSCTGIGDEENWMKLFFSNPSNRDDLEHPCGTT